MYNNTLYTSEAEIRCTDGYSHDTAGTDTIIWTCGQHGLRLRYDVRMVIHMIQLGQTRSSGLVVNMVWGWDTMYGWLFTWYSWDRHDHLDLWSTWSEAEIRCTDGYSHDTAGTDTIIWTCGQHGLRLRYDVRMVIHMIQLGQTRSSGLVSNMVWGWDTMYGWLFTWYSWDRHDHLDLCPTWSEAEIRCTDGYSHDTAGTDTIIWTCGQHGAWTGPYINCIG